MGRKNRNVNKFAQRKRDQKEKAKNPQDKPAADTRKHYEDIIRENAAFEEYYKTQKVCPEEEWSDFMSSLKENLPTAFRITGSKAEAAALLNIVKSEYFSQLLNVKIKNEEKGEEEEIKPVSLPWYPGGIAWQLRLSRTDIRRNEPLYKLHNFLVAETAAGGVSRQEAVSMIPPVVLKVEPHHKVLDMCAAPGSKTAQLIEFLHADEDKVPSGFVMANDVDNSRCYMLVHQAKRLNSPCILITNHDSALMPALVTTDNKDPTKTKPLKFDRILCDVPCSGDATLRKNPDIWLKWSTGNGNNLHGIRILPHHQDTGGFFVAVFEKTGLLPWEKTVEEKTEKETEVKEDKKEPPQKRRRMGGYREDPFVFFSGDDEDVFPSIKEYYDLKEDFDSKCLLTRCYVGKKKNIYLVSSIVKDVVQKNEANLKIINTGVKTFVRCDNKNMTCPFRLSQEGLQSILQYIGAVRRVNILKQDLILVLQNDNPSNPPDIKLFTEHTQNLVKDLATGSCVLQYQDTESNLKLTLVGWRGVHSLRAYTATPDTVHYLRLLGADYSKYGNTKHS
ncbi:tRNA (cytosine(34)-C(5))-methyltransferase [Papilio machaon]|uniref:tRNA (Cytosine(34)-C(5))-methyltransferase n=2 Tax=Papilio machaon TaxID=76193 RepID=A0A0N1PGP4_PAPMA|nr:tRNA (cytosine(34)-C(5))-methyltransferase [Papilio machaon]